MRKFFAVFAITSLLVAAGCDAGTGADGTTDDAIGDAGSTDDAGATAGDAGSTGGDVGATKKTYESAVIYDGSKAAPTVCSGTGPGADIDYIAVWRGGKVVAVGKSGTANYHESSAKGCADNDHGDAADVKAITGGFGDVCSKDGKALDTKDCGKSDLGNGYLSLAGGSVEVQFAACEKQGGEDPSATACSGDGDSFLVEPGDEIDVFEIGQQYKKDYGFSCKCADEGFEVDLRPKAGVETDSITLGGASSTKTFTVPGK